MTDTKNKIREVMLRQAITTCVTSGHNVDLETITKLRILPPDFFTGDPSDHSEIAETLLEMQREADAQSASLAPAPTEPPLAAEPEAEARRVVEGNTPQASDLYVPKLTLVEAHEQLAQVKQLLPQALDAQRVARVAMSRAINQFRKANGGTPTPDELMRQFAKSEQQQRAAMASGEIAPPEAPRRANSLIDAMSGRGGSANDHVRQNLRTGFRRGSFPSSMKGAYDGRYDQRRKLPSER